MTDEQQFENLIMASVDRTIAEAKELEGKTITREEVLKGWKQHLELAEKS